MTDRPFGFLLGLLTGHGNDLTDLLSTELQRGPRTLSIVQNLGGQLAKFMKLDLGVLLQSLPSIGEIVPPISPTSHRITIPM